MKRRFVQAGKLDGWKNRIKIIFKTAAKNRRFSIPTIPVLYVTTRSRI